MQSGWISACAGMAAPKVVILSYRNTKKRFVDSKGHLRFVPRVWRFFSNGTPACADHFRKLGSFGFVLGSF